MNKKTDTDNETAEKVATYLKQNGYEISFIDDGDFRDYLSSFIEISYVDGDPYETGQHIKELLEEKGFEVRTDTSKRENLKDVPKDPKKVSLRGTQVDLHNERTAFKVTYVHEDFDFPMNL